MGSALTLWISIVASAAVLGPTSAATISEVSKSGLEYVVRAGERDEGALLCDFGGSHLAESQPSLVGASMEFPVCTPNRSTAATSSRSVRQLLATASSSASAHHVDAAAAQRRMVPNGVNGARDEEGGIALLGQGPRFEEEVLLSGAEAVVHGLRRRHHRHRVAQLLRSAKQPDAKPRRLNPTRGSRCTGTTRPRAPACSCSPGRPASRRPSSCAARPASSTAPASM